MKWMHAQLVMAITLQDMGVVAFEDGDWKRDYDNIHLWVFLVFGNLVYFSLSQLRLYLESYVFSHLELQQPSFDYFATIMH